MDNTTWAYLAGVFDSEGSMGVYRVESGFKPYFVVSNTYLPLLDMIKDVTGQGYIVKRPLSKLGRKEIWQWSCFSSVALRHILPNVIPFMLEKRDRAEILLEFCSKASPGRRYTEIEQEERSVLTGQLSSALLTSL